MRREVFRAERAHALGVLARAPYVHLASVTAAGEPVLRALHGVLVGDLLCFHAAPAGEKLDIVGRPAVVTAEEIVAEIPSTFTDPQRACPATTLYESAQLHGVVERIDDPEHKARALQALMERFQPEGGHVPITARDPLYAAAVKGLLVCGISLERLDGKSKLAQNRPAPERRALLEKLWARGAPRDVAAIERILAANPDTPLPEFLRAPAPDVRLCCAVDASRAGDAARLLAGTYWNAGVSVDELAQAHRAATAWVGAFAADGTLLASARALSDGVKWAMLYDVIVAREQRGRGLGKAIVALLLGHPAVRGARKVLLGTRDAQGLYARFGFREVAPSSSGSTQMLLQRLAPDGSAHCSPP